MQRGTDGGCAQQARARVGRRAAGLLALALGCGGDGSGAAQEQLRSDPLLAAPVTRAKPGSSKDNGYTLFEAGPVRPVAVGPTGLVAVTNIPDDRLELFRPRAAGLEQCGSVHVGLRPVAVSAVGNDFWVVNHLSDSVSVVKVDGRSCAASVERTLLVGDEPRDVVAAEGAGERTYAFVTAAHRGQNVTQPDGTPRAPELSSPGVGRADVFVYDVQQLSAAAQGEERPLELLTLFTDSPRALAVGDGKVYAAGFLSGNRTSIVKYQFVVDRGRQSLARLDADGDFSIDASLPEEERRIEGGYPAISGHGRCISRGLSSPPGAPPLPFDFLMDVCVQTDPADPTRALSIVPQLSGAVTAECACTSAAGELQPTPPLIVRFFDSPEACGASYAVERGGCWLEAPQNGGADPLSSSAAPIAQSWTDFIAFSLPDRDVFTIDLSQSPPALLPGAEFSGVGTNLFNLAVHPKTGKLFASNTEARNLLRFEGPGAGASNDERLASTSVRGHAVESRISVLDPLTLAVAPVHLNAHIDRAGCCQAEPNADTERSLAFPLGLAISEKRSRGELLDDQELYVAAFGSDKVAVLSTARLEAAEPGAPVQDQSDHIEVPGGPAGLALDARGERLYVFTRFDNSLVVVDTNSRQVLQRLPMFSPEPDRVIAGRRFLYDARNTSSHGDNACASCHVFGDFDSLSWDLGAPDEPTLLNDGPFMEKLETLAAPLTSHFLSVKGPMATQSLRGLANHGAMHWRGDRRGVAADGRNEQPDTGAFDEEAAFKAFNVAFPGLNGRSEELPEADLQAFTDFALDISYPPNPIRRLDDRLTEAQSRALDTYFGCEATQDSVARGECSDGRNIEAETFACFCAVTPRFTLGLEPRPEGCPPDPVCTLQLSDSFQTCNGCHRLDPGANAEFGVDHPGLFGSNGFYSSDGVVHVMKVPHFRNLYQKVGMFGTVQTPVGVGLSDLPDSVFGARQGGLFATANAFQGDQIKGFGYTHAGEEDTAFHFMASVAFIKALSFGPPFTGDNLGAFELFLPRDRAACFDGQLPALNARFVSELGSEQQLAELRTQLAVLANPMSTPEQLTSATQALSGFIASLPAGHPGKVFEQTAVNQLSLPLLDCPALPDAASLASLGCFDVGFAPACAAFFGTVRSCAAWGSTLEQLLGSGTASCTAEGLEQRAEMEDFLFAYDSNLKPIVGQQVTVTRGAPPAALARLDLLLARARAGDCDVVAHFSDNARAQTGALYSPEPASSGQSSPEAGVQRFLLDRFLLDDGRNLPLAALRQRQQPVTFTAVPPGEGRRSGLDRDLDGVLDGVRR